MLYYKRLERGTFELPDYDASVGGLQLDYTQLVMLIDGVAITNITRRKRYKKPVKCWYIFNKGSILATR